MWPYAIFVAKIRPFSSNQSMTLSRISFQLLFFLLLTVESFGQIEMIERPKNKNTEIRYYGTGCFTIQRGDNVLLTDPFISNPSVGKLMFGKVRTDTSYVEKYINPATFKKVRMVVSAHAHYDHLMDIPYLSKYIPDESPIVGNRTTKHLLAYYKLAQPSVIVNNQMGTDSTLGKWIYSADSTMRTMAFKSLHPPHIAGINFLKKRYSADLVAEPLLISDWQEGQTLSFMVDFVEGNSISYRMFFMSSMAKSPFGLFPKSILKEHGVDDLFIGSSGKNEFESYPKPVVDLAKPKRIFLIHWENFFRSKDKPFKALDEKSLDEMKAALGRHCAAATEIIIPIPLNYY
jgi:hypothetical protein